MAAPVGLVAYDLLLGGEDQAPVSRWVQLASAEDLAREGIIYVEGSRIFLVDDPQGPIALYALSPHNLTGRERVLFCRTSGWFEEPRHGEKFDRRGRYAEGPASRGLDLLAARVEGRMVEVDVSVLYQGAPRNLPALPRAGESCTGSEGEPGFFGVSDAAPVSAA